MQSLDGPCDRRFLHQERNRAIRGAMAYDANFHIGDRREGAARNFGLTTDVFSDKRYQRFVIFPSHFRDAAQVCSNHSQVFR